jgi:hypothetical protein
MEEVMEGAAEVVGTVVAAVVVVAGGVEQGAVWPATLCLGGWLAVLRALSLWVSCSEGRLAEVFTMDTISVGMVLIETHPSTLAYSYSSNWIDPKKLLQRITDYQPTKTHSQRSNKSISCREVSTPRSNTKTLNQSRTQQSASC